MIIWRAQYNAFYTETRSITPNTYAVEVLYSQPCGYPFTCGSRNFDWASIIKRLRFDSCQNNRDSGTKVRREYFSKCSNEVLYTENVAHFLLR